MARDDDTPKAPAYERDFCGRIERLVKIDPASGCWIWQGATRGGYGRIKIGGRNGRFASVHVEAYRRWIGEIPEGMVLDHLCHTRDCPEGGECVHRRCVNPAHLKPVTHLENMQRGKSGMYQLSKTHCPDGHPYTPENTMKIPRRRTDGSLSYNRMCRECGRLRCEARRRTIYGQVKIRREDERACLPSPPHGKTQFLAHRVFFELIREKIPDGLVCDHICKVRSCCNPAHMELVTPRENVRRGDCWKIHGLKTHCPKGHPYDEQNTAYVLKANLRTYTRKCRACDRERHNRQYEGEKQRT